MLPKILVELFKDIFIKLLMLTGGVAALAIVVAALTCFVDSQDARRKIIKVCEVMALAMASSFVVWLVVTLVANYLNPMEYFDRLFDKKTYAPMVNMVVPVLKDLFR